MVVSELVADQCVLHHKLQGSVTFLDISRAMVVTSLHSELPTLWDFTEADETQDNFKHMENIPTFIAFARSASTGQKSAYLVSTNAMREELESLLSTYDIPWPWAVFDSEEEAFRWVLYEPGTQQ